MSLTYLVMNEFSNDIASDLNVISPNTFLIQGAFINKSIRNRSN